MSLSIVLGNALKLLIISGPASAVPLLFALTTGANGRQRVRVAAVACAFAATLLIIFALTGLQAFHFFGISLQAFKIAGGSYLVLVSLPLMLESRAEAERELSDGDGAAEFSSHVAITPLGLPLICGPGMISTTLLLGADLAGWSGRLSVVFSILLALAVLFCILFLSVKHVDKISPFALKVACRLTGVFIAALGFLIAWGGLTTFLENGSAL
jgi:multiple antibiotic resistance protein